MANRKRSSQLHEGGEQGGPVTYATQALLSQNPHQLDYTHSTTNNNSEHTHYHVSLLSEQDSSTMDTFWNDPADATGYNDQVALDFHGVGLDTGNGGQQFTFDEDFAPNSASNFDINSFLANNDQGQNTHFHPQHSTHHQPGQLDDSTGGHDFSQEGQGSAIEGQHGEHNGMAGQFDNVDDAASILQSISGGRAGNVQQAYAGIIYDGNGMPIPAGLGHDPSPMVSNGTSSTATNTPLTPTANTFQHSGQRKRGPPYATHTPQFLDTSLVPQPMHTPQIATPYVHNRAPPANFAQQQMQQQYAPYPMYQPSSGQRSSGPLVWGSDDGFRNGGFNGPAYNNNVDKSGNLTNVPLAELAASAARASMDYRDNEAVYGTPQQTRHHMMLNGQLRHHKNAASPSTHSTHTQPFDYPQYAGDYRNHNYDMGSTVQPTLKRSRGQMEGAAVQDTPPTARGKARRTTEPYKTEPADDGDGESPLLTPPGTVKGTIKGRPKKRPRVSAARAETLSSDTGSPATPLSGDNAANNARRRRSGARSARPNLSDEQKRKNHIASEQKRRNTMKQNFDELDKLVPSLLNGTVHMSRAEVLAHAAAFLETLMNCNDAMKTSYEFNVDHWRANGGAAQAGDDELDAVAGAYDDGVGT